MYDSIDDLIFNKKQVIIGKLKTISPENIVDFSDNIRFYPGDTPLHSNEVFNEYVFVKAYNNLVLHRVLEFKTTSGKKLYKVRIQQSLLETHHLLRTIMLLQLSVLLALIIAMMLINQNIEHKVWRPFYDTLEKLKKYRVDNDLIPVFNRQKICELDELNQSLTLLTRKNRQLFQSQKEFTENASHELQAPLAVIQSNVDLYWQTTPYTHEQAQIISKISEVSNHMSRLNRALLLLTKIENGQFENNKILSLDTIVHRVIQDFDEFFKDKNLQIILKEIAETTITADAVLIDILINNLITNAIRHTECGGNILISLQNKLLVISNTSSSGALDIDMLFKRFHKQNRLADSSGLGLEICKKICEIYDYKINYEHIQNYHYFSVDFKSDKEQHSKC